jgi:hypothetical protein
MKIDSLLDGRYKILEEVGGGAMGAVYRALDTRLERTVAIKTIRLDLHSAELADFRRRFEIEARATGRLNHPNIVIVYDSGVAATVAFIVMEFLSGTPLDALIRNVGRFNAAAALAIVSPVAEALAYAHAHGVIHRDVKPGNIIQLDSGIIKLTDFGIAQTTNADLTQTGVVLGTPKYMAPEQIAGLRVDGRADVFSLGGVLYELLTGRAPFAAPTLVSLMHTVLNSTPEDPRRLVPDLPRGAVMILARCLAKDPAARYQSSAELAAALKRSAEISIDDALIAQTFRGASAEGRAKGIGVDTGFLATQRLAPAGASVSSAKRRWTGLGPRASIILASTAIVLCASAAYFYSEHVRDSAAPGEPAATLPTAGPGPAAAPVIEKVPDTTITATPSVEAAGRVDGAAPPDAPTAGPTGPAHEADASRALSPAPASVAAPVAAPIAQAHPRATLNRTSVASQRAHAQAARTPARSSAAPPAEPSAEAEPHDPVRGFVSDSWHRVRHGIVSIYDEQRDCIRYNKCPPTQPQPEEPPGQRSAP